MWAAKNCFVDTLDHHSRINTFGNVSTGLLCTNLTFEGSFGIATKGYSRLELLRYIKDMSV